MGRTYAVCGNCVNTASSTLPIMNVVGSTATRPSITEINLGSDATPADNTCKYAFQRSTTAGTWGGAGGAAITPQAIDPVNPASSSTANQGVCSVGPTLTASAFVWQDAINQRSTFRWIAASGKGLVIPATASNGLSLMPLVVGGSAYNAVFTVYFDE